MQQLPLRVGRPDIARFDSFVTGGNLEVVDLLRGRDTPPVLWLWGRAGAGKSHLLRAACAAANERGQTATYLDLAAVDEPRLLEGCESLEIVALDGLDRVAERPDWNAAIFRLHTLMHDLSGRLLVASRTPPAVLRFALADLGSRLLAAAVYQIHELDEDGQVRALIERAASRGLELPNDSALYLVHHVRRDMHSLCRTFDRLDVAAMAAQRRLTVPFLRGVLESQPADSS